VCSWSRVRGQFRDKGLEHYCKTPIRTLILELRRFSLSTVNAGVIVVAFLSCSMNMPHWPKESVLCLVQVPCQVQVPIMNSIKTVHRCHVGTLSS